MSTVIIDYGVGNIGSLMGALDEIEMDYVFSGDKRVIDAATSIILPGVGAFAPAMNELKKRNLVDLLKKKAETGTPFLGICLGMQLLFESSEENGAHQGLSLIKGEIKKIPATVKIPHMGWNSLTFNHPQDELLKNNKPGDYVYYVHSYYVATAADKIIASSHYGIQIPGIARQGTIIGMQFHPEKSSDAGLSLLKAFKELVE